MKNHSTWKRICGMLLAMVLMIPCAALPAYADGSHTVSGTYAPEGVTLPKATEFKLYKVGGFDRSEDGTKSILVLDPALAEKGFDGEVNLGIQKESYEKEDGSVDTDKWTEDWLAQAKTLADWIDAQSESPVEVKTTSTSASGYFSFAGLENGLYLLTGGPRQKIEGTDGSSTYYFPRPMLVQVLNADVELTVKPGTENVKDFTVLKMWDDQGKEVLRPASIDVKITYGGELDRTVTLSQDIVTEVPADGSADKITYEKADADHTKVTTYKGESSTEKTLDKPFVSWAYSWETNKVEETWAAIEELTEEDAMNYAYSTTENVSGPMKTIILTNKFERVYLDITKLTDQLTTGSESSNITVAFKLTGYIGDKVVYTGSAAKVIENKEEKLTVPAIPRNLTRLVVEEEYSGANYAPKDKVKDATKIDAVAEEGEAPVPAHYEVTFENEYNGDTTVSGGIVNTFKQIKDEVYNIVEREGYRG